MRTIHALFMSDSEKGFLRWKEELSGIAPFLTLHYWKDDPNPESIEIALAWRPNAGIFPKLTNLKLIQSLGMGVDHLFKCRDLPNNIPISRIIDPDMSRQMAEYVLYGALTAFRNFQKYRIFQESSTWETLPRHFHNEFKITILGFGELGKAVANRLLKNGFSNIHAWAKSPKTMDNITTYVGEAEFSASLMDANLLICLLPLTSKTKNILNADTFQNLSEGAYLINPARGEHLVEKDLLQALDSGKLSGALLDVFREEPLPRNHPFWLQENLTLTPHVAASTNPRTARDQVVENIMRIVTGKAARNLIDHNQEY